MADRTRIASIPLWSHSFRNQLDCRGIALFLEIPPQSGLVNCGLIGLCFSNFHRREWNQCEDCGSAFYSKILQSCNPATISVDCKEWKLDCSRIVKYRDFKFCRFWLSIDLDGTIYVWTHIVPSFAALSWPALVLQPWAQSACNPHWLHKNH